MLEQIPFLQNCEDEDSDEDDELDSVQHKKQRVKVRARARGAPTQEGPPACRGPLGVFSGSSEDWSIPSPCSRLLSSHAVASGPFRSAGLFCQGNPFSSCTLIVLSTFPPWALMFPSGLS